MHYRTILLTKKKVLSKFLPDTNLNFMDKAQYTSFNNFYEELFEVLSENFEKRRF